MALNRYYKNENKVSHFTLLVKNYDDAIEFYTNILGFKVKVDEYIHKNSRWVSIENPTQGNIEITFVEAVSAHQKSKVGKQGSRHSFMVLESSSWEAEINRLRELGIQIEIEIKDNFLNSEAVFQDLYGNNICLIPKAEKLETITQ